MNEDELVDIVCAHTAQPRHVVRQSLRCILDIILADIRARGFCEIKGFGKFYTPPEQPLVNHPRVYFSPDASYARGEH